MPSTIRVIPPALKRMINPPFAPLDVIRLRGPSPLDEYWPIQQVRVGVDRLRIIFKEKQNSSGSIRNGEILLYISSRLSRAEQQRHIDILTAKLEPRLDRARRMALQIAQQGPPPGLTPSPVANDQALTAWAEVINQEYYGFTLGQVRFRKQESRWGSCSGRTRNIQISHRLQGGPHELLEYVLIHEIAHLSNTYPPHSAPFWRWVEIACPDWRERRRLLREYERWLSVQSDVRR